MTGPQRDIMANVERLHRFMDQHGCAAIVARSGKNFTYLAGFASPGTLARHLDFPDSPREVLVLWPRHGEAVLIVNHYAAPLARRDSWVRRVEVYDDYAESPYARLATVLQDLGLQREMIGVEKTYVSAARWEELHTLLPDATLVDCTAMMARVRWVKTAGEIHLLKHAADLLDDAYLEVFPSVRVGETERAVHSRLVQSCLRRGAQWAHGLLNASRNTIAYGGEGDTVFQAGDIIRNDYVAYCHGYPGHQSRTVILGEPSAEQRRIYRLMRDIYRRTIEQCRAGVKASTIHAFAAGQFREHGYHDRVSLVGHSVGPWWHQQEPYIVSTCDDPLEAGMVLALEPHVGSWHLQDLVLVTPEGPQLLSDRFNTDDIFVIE